jgi:hypothetical protein
LLHSCAANPQDPSDCRSTLRAASVTRGIIPSHLEFSVLGPIAWSCAASDRGDFAEGRGRCDWAVAD